MITSTQTTNIEILAFTAVLVNPRTTGQLTKTWCIIKNSGTLFRSLFMQFRDFFPIIQCIQK